MAIRECFDRRSQARSVKEQSHLPCGGEVDANPSRSNPLRKSHGISNERRDINKAAFKLVKNYRLGKNQRKDNDSDSLSDIDDAEVVRYLNNKEEMHYKRILWEVLYGNCEMPKKRKRTETKKLVSAKRAANTTEKVAFQQRNSRINYDALALVNNETMQDSETTQTFHPNSCGSGNSPDNHNESFGYHNSTIDDDADDDDDDDDDEHIYDEYFDF